MRLSSEDKEGNSNLSVIGGALFRTTNWLYLRTGIGYGLYNKENKNREMFDEYSHLYDGVQFEAGGIIKIKKFTLSAGYTTIIGNKTSGFWGDIIFGAGIMF